MEYCCLAYRDETQNLLGDMWANIHERDQAAVEPLHPPHLTPKKNKLSKHWIRIKYFLNELWIYNNPPIKMDEIFDKKCGWTTWSKYLNFVNTNFSERLAETFSLNFYQIFGSAWSFFVNMFPGLMYSIQQDLFWFFFTGNKWKIL